jgi:hypothetical protein
MLVAAKAEAEENNCNVNFDTGRMAVKNNCGSLCNTKCEVLYYSGVR